MFRGRPSARGWPRLRRAIQDRLWARDEGWARSRGYVARRDPGGWGITIRDPRWDTRSECGRCAGEGLVGAAECDTCGGTGVVVEQVEGRLR